MTTRSSFALSRYATTARFGLRLRCLAGSETSYQLSSHSLEGRQRVGLTPDLLLRFPTPDGVSDCLGELKAMYRGRMKSRRTDGRGSFRQLIGAHLKGLTGSTLGRHQATQDLWWQGFRVMATCSVCTMRSNYLAPGTAKILHQVQHLFCTRNNTIFIPGRAFILHQAQELFYTRCSKRFASGTAPILHQLQHQFCTRYTTIFAQGKASILQQVKHQFCTWYSTIFHQVQQLFCSRRIKYFANILRGNNLAPGAPVLHQV